VQQYAWQTPREPRRPDDGEERMKAIAHKESLLADYMDDADIFGDNHAIWAEVSANLAGEVGKEAIVQSYHSVWTAPSESGLQNSMSVTEAARSGKGWWQQNHHIAGACAARVLSAEGEAREKAEAPAMALNESKRVHPAAANTARTVLQATAEEFDHRDFSSQSYRIVANVSANLVGEADKETVEQEYHSVWEAPKESGLHNSMSVTEAAKLGKAW